MADPDAIELSEVRRVLRETCERLERQPCRCPDSKTRVGGDRRCQKHEGLALLAPLRAVLVLGEDAATERLEEVERA